MFSGSAFTNSEIVKYKEPCCLITNHKRSDEALLNYKKEAGVTFFGLFF